MPMTVGGMGRSALCVQIDAVMVSGCTTRSSRPTA
jgi:hypothetical protein